MVALKSSRCSASRCAANNGAVSRTGPPIVQPHSAQRVVADASSNTSRAKRAPTPSTKAGTRRKLRAHGRGPGARPCGDITRLRKLVRQEWKPHGVGRGIAVVRDDAETPDRRQLVIRRHIRDDRREREHRVDVHHVRRDRCAGEDRVVGAGRRVLALDVQRHRPGPDRGRRHDHLDRARHNVELIGLDDVAVDPEGEEQQALERRLLGAVEPSTDLRAPSVT